MSKKNQVPESRSYVHAGCGGRTIVSGHDFEQLCNPFSFTTGTVCAICEKVVPTKQVAWADTGEPIAAYRRRLRAAAPASQKVVSWIIGPAILGVVGSGIAYAFKPGDGVAIAIGFVTGALCYLGVISHLLTRMLFSVDYRAFE